MNSQTIRRRPAPGLVWALPAILAVIALIALGSAAPASAANPVVTGVSPNSGSTAGGLQVTITGSGLSGTTISVTFGGTPAASFTPQGPLQMQATSPAHVAGQVDIVVTVDGTPSATSANSKFTYVSTVPVISSLNPSTGPTTGNTAVSITGSGFTGATSVSFGGTPSTLFSIVNDQLINAISPAHVAGAVNVVVTTPSGSSVTGPSTVFTYTGQSPAPQVTSVSPNTGPSAGGTVVTITGSGFTGATSVTFGGTPATTFTINSDVVITATAPAHIAGVVFVIVTGPGGSSQAIAAAQFTYTSSGTGPTITSLNPTGGPTTGGTLVSIFGSGFLNASSVTFGGTAAFFNVVNDSQITATAPAHVAGSYYVVVTTPLGQSPLVVAALYTFGAGQPVVSSINPAGGPTTGGTVVAIFGSGFLGTTSVVFGGIASTSFNVLSDSQISAVAPPHVAGAVYVIVSNSFGSSGSVAAAIYTYGTTVGPNITSINPSNGPISGGTTVTILGSGFTGATFVTFGGTSATSFTVQSDSQITAISPARLSAATVHIQVTTPLGSSPLVNADLFTYGSGGPVITSLTPTSGPVTGGTTVIITGSGFTGATSVTFGTGYFASFVVNSNTQITATTPAHPAGLVYVVVTTSQGNSGAPAAALFTYGVGIPIVSSVSPTTGPTTGGTTVTISGTGFTGATSVTFGSTPAASFVVVNDSTITAVTPARSAGTVEVIVTTSLGTSTGSGVNFTFTAGLPIVTGVSPTSGPVGTRVTLTGAGFTGATAVTFGGVAGITVTVVSDTQITVTVPTVSGTVDIIVTTPLGSSSSTTTARFTVTGVSTTTYTLTFRWSLIVWRGADGVSIATAMRGQETPDNPATNNVYSSATAIFRWNASLQRWQAFFPGSENVPGANDFTVFNTNVAYFIAISGGGTLTWVALN